MKKVIATAMAAFLLASCSTGNISSLGGLGSASGMGSGIVKMAVENQCRVELSKRNEWRVVALAMSAEKQEEWESKICGCVSEEAPNQLTAAELVQVVSPATRTQVISSVTAKTVTACVKRLYK